MYLSKVLTKSENAGIARVIDATVSASETDIITVIANMIGGTSSNFLIHSQKYILYISTVLPV